MAGRQGKGRDANHLNVTVVQEKLAHQLGAALEGETRVGALAVEHRHEAEVVLFLGTKNEVEMSLMERAELPHTQSYSHNGDV